MWKMRGGKMTKCFKCNHSMQSHYFDRNRKVHVCEYHYKKRCNCGRENPVPVEVEKK